MFKNIYVRLLLITIVLMLGVNSYALQKHNSSYSRSDQEENALRGLAHHDLWVEVRKNFAITADLQVHGIREQISWYQQHQSYLNRMLAQGAPYIYYIYQEVTQRGLPAEMVLIPLIESSYNPFLYSKVGAAGLWQMMPRTATSFGLKINWWYDGRRDVVAATKAALKYITYLHYFFNDDWLLAIAAYDAGEGKVQAAVLKRQRKQLPADFWSLELPKETQKYLPKLLALAAIIKHPERYHIHLKALPNTAYFATVDVGTQCDIGQVAKLAGVEVSVLQRLNPGFKRWAPDPEGPYHWIMPVTAVARLQEALRQGNEQDFAKWQRYVVQEGDTLAIIAHRVHVPVAYLQQVNALPTTKIKVRDSIIIPGTQASVTNTHTVQARDTLLHLAQRYKTTVAKIRALNLLYTDNLKIGQKLKIPHP